MRRLVSKLMLTAILFATSISATAQMNPGSPVAADPDTRIGTLPNGLTYYIRYNNYPKGQADFYIYSDVGAIQEEDDQQGLAHFLEHMAFNGTKNLPGKQLIEYLERIGVKFGANLNAYTSWDKTVYMMKDVPTARDGVIDTALLILNDWAYYIEPQADEIDKERGVIKEELRTRDGASWRSYMAMVKALGLGSRYEHRNLIGTLEGLDSFPHEALTRFYHDWYRPDYQAFIVVGDIDVDEVEAKIKKLASKIPAPAKDAPQKEEIHILGNVEPIISIYTDPEMQMSNFMITSKSKALPKESQNTNMAMLIDVAKQYISTMLNNRFVELVYTEESPLQSAYYGVGSMGIIPTLEGGVTNANVKEGRLQEAFELIYTELERVRRFGFNQGEWERAKTELITASKRRYDARFDRTNDSYVQEYIAAYAQNIAIPEPFTRHQIENFSIALLTLDQLNEIVADANFTDNLVITVNSPLKAGVEVPTSESLLTAMEFIAASQLEQLPDNRTRRELINMRRTNLEGSPIIQTQAVAELGALEWTLQNGVTVVVKPTQFKRNEIVMSATASGGASLLQGDEHTTAALYYNSIAREMGIADFSVMELRKQLAGKSVSLTSSLSDYSTSINGMTTPDDLETLMQLLYLQFTAPRHDQADFNNVVARVRNSVENMYSNPDNIARREFNNTLYNNNSRRQMASVESLDKVKMSHMRTIHDKLFSDGDSYRFVFSGNVNIERLRPLVEQYLGSIPTHKKNTAAVDDGVRKVDGAVVNDFTINMEQPKVRVTKLLHTGLEQTLETQILSTYLRDALSNHYLETIREQRGGTYGVGVNVTGQNNPNEESAIYIQFDTNPDMADELIDAVMEGLVEMASDGPSAIQVAKTREFLNKNYSNQMENNWYWVSMVNQLYDYNIDYRNEALDIINKVKPADIANFARTILADGNITKVVMRPEIEIVTVEDGFALSQIGGTPQFGGANINDKPIILEGLDFSTSTYGDDEPITTSTPKVSILIQYETEEDMVDELMQSILESLEKIADQTPAESISSIAQSITSSGSAVTIVVRPELGTYTGDKIKINELGELETRKDVASVNSIANQSSKSQSQPKVASR